LWKYGVKSYIFSVNQREDRDMAEKREKEERKIAPSPTNGDGAMHIRKYETSEMLNHESW